MKDKLTVQQIKNQLQEITSLTDPFIETISNDPRKGVQQAINSRKRQLEQLALDKKEYDQKLSYERQLWLTHPFVAGVDEVGRGPLAGPVVAASVILPTDPQLLIGVNDSKQLSRVKRQHFVDLIKKVALSYAVAVVDAPIIDELNIYQATRLAMKQAVEQLSLQPDALLIDAMMIESDLFQKSLVKGDQQSLSIAAASILAKEYRDQIMREYHQKYPQYGFDRHMGYGTKEHLEALKEWGPCPIHRYSFDPVKKVKK
ncbi:ribonuclease HII [Dolosicoccus paucivorans]|uniref:Ribonuclease HII n=2 Tax=Dolosicoccus paucivorans TaxID=84521 RepID=A0A1G8J5I4_9LACT|nr:ribonuclease HII [Dolosicoccus paucivorans]PMB84154.1 ribonuclease HII [Dolosicoccus paucivorans]PMC59086.1 ribonuclease HII [Dolosicoccus paucivorans]SDI26293.1 RNase HII [Dolosicoccus paucivorans]